MSKFSDATFYLAPSGYRESILYPQKPLSSIGHLSFTRASSATRTNAAGQIEQVCYNLFQYSEDFSNAYWTKSLSTLTTNTTVAPDGNLTADTFTKTSGVNTVSQCGTNAPPYTNTGVHTLSVYIKPIVGNTVLLRLDNANNTANATFNFTTKTFSTSGANLISSSYQELPNGWFRLSITGNVTSTSWTASPCLLFENPTNDSMAIWGAQLVQGNLPKDYLYTSDRLNFPRVDFSDGFASFLLEPQRTNFLRNSTMVGASTSPNTIPTNWIASLGGLTATIVDVGTENGLPYIDIRFNGTAISTVTTVTLESNTQIAASNGQTWTSSFWIKEVSASAPPLLYRNGITERDSGGSSLGAFSQTITISSTLTRNIFTRTNTQASTTRINNSFSMTLTIGNSYDFTVRVAAPQMELGAFATTFIPTSTVSVTRLADTLSTSNIFTNNLISSSGGTWFVELKNNFVYTRDAAAALYLGDSTVFVGNSFNIFTSPSGRLLLRKAIAGTQTNLYTTLTDTVKILFKWNGSTADLFVNGIKQASATAFTTVNMENLNLSSIGTPFFIQQMALWNTSLSDSQCIELTV